MATPGHRQHGLTARLAAAPRPACAVELLSPRRARSFRRVREAEAARLFLPGGSGRRMCPDFIFAQFNIEIALANLLYHFVDWEFPCSENRMELDMTRI
uniref:Cytochrome P450 n=1 Tax=Oryza glaberrima TaxID=4538 RepID=I1NVC8_ORYGL